MMDCATDQRELKHLCGIFLHIFDAYAAGLRHLSAPADVVLKIVPASLISSAVRITLPTAKQLVRISIDIYDNCPGQVEATSPYSSLSLVQLTPQMPEQVDFRLSRTNPTVLLQQQSVAHVAYCWNEESLWLTAALTDTLGCHSWSASYYVGARSGSFIAFRAVVKEILEIVREALEEAHGLPKLIVARDRTYHPAEIESMLCLFVLDHITS